MSSTPKGNEITERQATSIRAAQTEEVSVKKSALDEDVRRRATKSISDAANNRTVRWTIGSRPNANSNTECLRARRRARKLTRDSVNR